jgi:hypothetical protein
MLPAERAENASHTERTTPVAWTPGKDIDVYAWVRVGHRLGGMARCSQWWLGDWIRYGTTRWGEKYKEAARITGYDVQSLRNIAYVAGRIETSRRRDDLTWSHHAEVCALAPEQQDDWLQQAAAQRMSVADLRFELRSVRRLEGESAERAKAEAKVVTCPECEHRFTMPGS